MMGYLTLQQNCPQELENKVKLLLVPTMFLFQFLNFIRLGKAAVSKSIS